MFALCLYPKHYQDIKNFNYVPVGLGQNKFSDKWITDKSGENIANKNPYYGEYTFHYWLWKNMLDEITEEWIGFCGYRYFWQKNNVKLITPQKKDILLKIPDEWNNYEAIIPCVQSTNNIKFLKIIKNGGLTFLFNKETYFKKTQSIKFHFQVFHGKNDLDNAIDLLNVNEREEFRNYVNNETSFHKWNMFICKSKDIIKAYYKSLFPWLLECEKLFGFELKGYGKRRIYGFLAERYLSFWFTKNTNFKSWETFRYNLDLDKK